MKTPSCPTATSKDVWELSESQGCPLGAKASEGYREPAPLVQPLLSESPSDAGTAAIVPDDADRADMFQALRRLTALPDNIQSEITVRSSKVDPIGQTDDDSLQESFSKPSEKEQSEVGTAEIHSAFERLAERRGLSQDYPTVEESQVRTSELGQDLASEIADTPTQLREEVAILDDEPLQRRFTGNRR